MKVDKIYLKANSKFSERIAEWASERAKEVVMVSEKLHESFDLFDSMLIFNENQTLSKEVSDVKMLFDKQQKAVHKIDINGTLMVGMSNLDLWAEQSKCKNLLLIGGDELVKNHNLDRYITASK
jgi:energy-coupling factor transporter ATP-binding protein EcfA2